MEQGTREWLEWRRQGIGASESAALLGVCPYKTAFKLWQEKLGQGQKDEGEETSEVLAKGHSIEAQIRAAYEFEEGIDFPPALMEHGVYPFIRASLDGLNQKKPKGIEIKYVGAAKMDLPIPEHHVVQMQHQMLVTNLEEWTYLRSTDGIHFKADVVKADPVMQAAILNACLEFWNLVQTKTPPPYCDRDWVPVDDEDLATDLGSLPVLKGKAKEALRENIFSRMQYNRIVCRGIKVARDTRRITFPKE